jgi:hypothetical protein
MKQALIFLFIRVDEENRLSEHNEFVGFVSVPSQDEIEKYLVEHQKKVSYVELSLKVFINSIIITADVA